MLVLTRKNKETIKIGDSITITILRVQGQAVRVGIEAPRDIRVVRGELGDKQAVAQNGSTEEVDSSPEPEVIQFRFSPDKVGVAPSRKLSRGPLASLMTTLSTPGYIAEAISK